MRNHLRNIFLILPILLLSCAQNNGHIKSDVTENEQNTIDTVTSDFSIVFYNTENLYDTKDDPGIIDEEFTPDAAIPWTQERFNTKLERLSDVFGSVVVPQMPDIIGLAEVENKTVLSALIQTAEMKKSTYDIVHFDSPDERGIDVALIFNRETFKVTDSEPLTVRISGNGDRTRDILYVKGKTAGGQILHLFVNHWPSRREGTQESEYKRMKAAGTLRKKVDEIYRSDANASIVIMGDFNDEPDDRSISETLSAVAPAEPYSASKLYNLLYPEFERGTGTTFYKDWDLFDQLIVSGSLLMSKRGLHCTPESASIFSPKRLIHRDRNGNTRPNRTMGDKYYGGYSDHLPVALRLVNQGIVD